MADLPEATQDILRATYTLYLHALHGDGPDADALKSLDPAPMTLDEAIGVLNRDESTHGRQRKQRVATRIALGRHSRERGSLLKRLGIAPEPVDGALRALRDEKARLANQGVGLAVPPASGPSPGLHEQMDPYMITRVAFVIGQKLGVPVDKGACEVRLWPSAKIVREEPKGSVTMHAELQVDADIDLLRSAFDPRRWDECSDLFIKTTLVDANLDEVPSSQQPAIGSDLKGYLHEKFAATLGNWTISTAEVLLKISAHANGDTHTVSYELERPIALTTWLGTIDGTDGRGVVIDDGAITIEPSDGPGTPYKVKVLKQIKVTGFGIASHAFTVASGLYLLISSDELAHFSCCRHG